MRSRIVRRIARAFLSFPMLATVRGAILNLSASFRVLAGHEILLNSSRELSGWLKDAGGTKALGLRLREMHKLSPFSRAVAMFPMTVSIAAIALPFETDEERGMFRGE